MREENRKISERKGKEDYHIGREEGRKISERKGKEVCQGKKRIED